MKVKRAKGNQLLLFCRVAHGIDLIYASSIKLIVDFLHFIYTFNRHNVTNTKINITTLLVSAGLPHIPTLS